MTFSEIKIVNGVKFPTPESSCQRQGVSYWCRGMMALKKGNCGCTLLIDHLIEPAASSASSASCFLYAITFLYLISLFLSASSSILSRKKVVQPHFPLSAIISRFLGRWCPLFLFIIGTWQEVCQGPGLPVLSVFFAVLGFRKNPENIFSTFSDFTESPWGQPCPSIWWIWRV